MKIAIALAMALAATTGALAEDDFAGLYVGGGLFAGGSHGEPDIRSGTPLGFIGYSWQNGPWLFGLEFGVRTDMDTTVQSQSRSNEYFWHTSPWELPTPFTGTIIERLPTGDLIARNTTTTHLLREHFGSDLSFRVGRKMGDLLVYGKLGAGAALLENTTQVNTKSLGCPGFRYRLDYGGGRLHGIYQECDGPTFHTNGTSTDRDYEWEPTVLGAIGLEQNVGHLFFRAEGEARHIFADDAFTRYSAGLFVGVRF